MRSSEQAPRSVLVEKLQTYRPLIVVALVALGAGILMDYTGRAPFMEAAMGLFWVLVAALKLYDTKGFADLFVRYDLMAARHAPYARAYPFIELAIGMGYLAGAWPLLTNLAAIVICAIAVMSVMRVMQTGKIVNCACIGAGFSVPVGGVTLFEYATMGLMAAFNLFLIGAM